MAGITQQGRGTLLAIMDICQAYRNISIHPSDRPIYIGHAMARLDKRGRSLSFVLRSYSSTDFLSDCRCAVVDHREDGYKVGGRSAHIQCIRQLEM